MCWANVVSDRPMLSQTASSKHLVSKCSQMLTHRGVCLRPGEIVSGTARDGNQERSSFLRQYHNSLRFQDCLTICRRVGAIYLRRNTPYLQSAMIM